MNTETIYKNLLTSILIALSCALIIDKFLKEKTLIEYKIKTHSATQTQLYWNNSAKHNGGVAHINQSLKATPIINKARFTIDASFSTKLTIVPIVSANRFSISAIEIKRNDILFNPFDLLSLPVLIETAIESKSIQPLTGSYDFLALSNRPLFTFVIDSPKEHQLLIISINTISIALILLLVTTLTQFFFKSASITNYSVFILIPIFMGFAYLNAAFRSVFFDLIFIFKFVISGFIIINLICLIIKQNIKPITFCLLSIITYMLLPDISYRLNLMGNKVYSKVYTPVYNWRLGRTIDINIVHSGAAYHDDFKKIKALVEPYSSFISDRATSYYALAVLPLYLTVSHGHHGGGNGDFTSTFLSHKFLKFLCSSETRFDTWEINKFISKKNELHKKNNWPIVKYIILNKDRNNHVIRRMCINGLNENVIQKINSISVQVYKGKYLDLYKIKY